MIASAPAATVASTADQSLPDVPIACEGRVGGGAADYGAGWCHRGCSLLARAAGGC